MKRPKSSERVRNLGRDFCCAQAATKTVKLLLCHDCNRAIQRCEARGQLGQISRFHVKALRCGQHSTFVRRWRALRGDGGFDVGGEVVGEDFYGFADHLLQDLGGGADFRE